MIHELEHCLTNSNDSTNSSLISDSRVASRQLHEYLYGSKVDFLSFFFLADPKLVNFNSYVVLNYVNFVRRQQYIQQMRVQQERMRNATLEAIKKRQELLKQGQQVGGPNL